MSKNKKTRKLAAVMFVDMVGYTQLMQTNEQQAIINRDQHRKVLRSEVKKHGGEILQYFGDGTLVIYSSSVQAVKAGVAIQKAMLFPYKIPLRIGIHVGDVTYDKEGLYGDSVNIAARIESMAVPYSVVVSDRVKEQIKNQKDLPVKALGHFKLKNVKRPIELFALANEGLIVPDVEDMKGKGAPVLERLFSLKKLMLPLAVLLMVMGFIYFSANKKSNFFEEIKDDRVAVLVFKNNTGNPDLDYIGEMTSEWVTRALMETKKAKVVNTNSVKQNMQLASLVPMGKPKEDSFSKVTGAKYIVHGSYYKENGELIFSSQINDAISGTVRFSFQEFRGDLEKPSEVIKLMKNKIAGYWLTQGKVLQSRFSPPNKDAWLEFQKGREAWGGANNKNLSHQENVQNSLLHFQKAIALDSTFMLPWIQVGMCYKNIETGCSTPKTDAHFKVLESKKHLMTEYEWNVFQIDKYRFAGQYKSANEFAKKNYELDPLSLRDNFLYGNTAIHFGKIDATIQAHSKIPFDLIPNSTDRKNIIMNLSFAYFFNNQIDKALETIEYGTYPWKEIDLKSFVHIKKKEDAAVLQLMKGDPKNFEFLTIGGYAKKHGRSELAKQIFTFGKKYAKEKEIQAIYDFHLKNYKESLQKLESAFNGKSLDEMSAVFMLYFFLNYYKADNLDKANLCLSHLEKLSKKECANYSLTPSDYYMTALASSGKISEVENIIKNSNKPSPYMFLRHHPILYQAMKDNAVYKDWVALD